MKKYFRISENEDMYYDQYYIIIDKKTQRALHGINNRTLTFDTPEEAENLAKQLCKEYTILEIQI